MKQSSLADALRVTEGGRQIERLTQISQWRKRTKRKKVRRESLFFSVFCIYLREWVKKRRLKQETSRDKEEEEEKRRRHAPAVLTDESSLIVANAKANCPQSALPRSHLPPPSIHLSTHPSPSPVGRLKPHPWQEHEDSSVTVESITPHLETWR